MSKLSTTPMANLPSRALVDGELLPILEAAPRAPVNAATLDLTRQASAMPLPFDFGGRPERVEVRRFEFAGPPGAPLVSGVLYRPVNRTEPLPGIFHIHGGGFVAGAAAAMEPIHRALVDALGCALFSVDYRLAPEHPFPAPLCDCHAGLEWLFRHAEELGVDADRIGLMGESAGGGLAAALALLVRDRGERRLQFQYLVYPMLDDRTCTQPEPHPYAGDYVWTPDNNHFGWSALLGAMPGSADVPAYAAPARATHLAGLPRTFISTAALDLFLEENLEYARRLTRAGVPLELHVYPGAVHGFDLVPLTELARRARRDQLDALARLLG